MKAEYKENNKINSNQNIASCLLNVPIFSKLHNNYHEGILNLSKVKKVYKGGMVYMAGQKNASLYVIHKGLVKISRYNENGGEQVVRVLSPGDFVGEHALFDNKLSDDFAIALEDSVLCVIKGDDLKEYMLKHPTISIEMITELNKRLLDSENKLKQFNLSSVESRVSQSILKLSKGKEFLTLPFSKENWSSMLGMSQETLSRKLKEFKDKNVISLKGQREIIILDKSYLEDLSEF